MRQEAEPCDKSVPGSIVRLASHGIEDGAPMMPGHRLSAGGNAVIGICVDRKQVVICQLIPLLRVE